MAFNGSGTFVRLYNWVTDKANAVNITASRMDGEDDGFAAGLSNCITRDGQGKPSAAIDWNGQNLSNIAALTTTGNTSVGGTLAVTGTSTLTGNVTASGSLTAASAVVTAGLTANGGISVPAIVLKYKPADTSRASDNTPSADPDLVYVIPSAGTYAFRIVGHVNSGAGGSKLAMNYSAAFTAAGSVWRCFGVFGGFFGGVSLQTGFAGTSTFTNGASSTDWFIIEGNIQPTATGTLSFYWSQANVNVANTTMAEGSYMSITKIA